MNEDWQKIKSYMKSDHLELGPYFTFNLKNVPRHSLFCFSRYKFAAKMIGESPKSDILELGCNEGLGTLILAENHSVTAVDFDEEAIKWSKENLGNKVNFICDDFLGKTYGEFDAVVSLDVIEHIAKDKEDAYFLTITENLKEHGCCIIGTPNEAASQFSSEVSRMGHINNYSATRLRDTARRYFHNVFLFSMNDEMVHTGFYPLAHYLIVVGCSKKLRS